MLSQVEITAGRETFKPHSRFAAYTEAVKVVTCTQYRQITIKVTVCQMDTLKFVINSKNLKVKVLFQY